MQFLALIPYLTICSGLLLGQLGLRPAMRGWAICMVGALSGLVVAIVMIFGAPELSWGFAVVAVLPFVVTVISVVKDLSYPRLNDVATDLDAPLKFVVALGAAENARRDMSYPERFKSHVRSAYPQIQSLILDEPADQLFARVVRISQSQSDWRVTHLDAENKTLEVEATTSLLRFVDDVVIRVSEHEGNSCVDMRSKSREGLVDAGKNAKRIEAFFELVKKG